ncbi:MAG TPA: RNA polymerase sigma factor [Vicinamibacterales bacterium]|jgi:RNA polymerase sigma-70 factor (ECF subfamily)|nr:RNA polymerase sigma factor [Vicinamibacterales bacterium]
MAPAAKKGTGDAGARDAEAALARSMEGYLAGQIDAFDALYAALAGRLRGYLLSLCRDASTADDLVQETFVQIHRSRRTYEPGRPVTPWAFAIARHVYLMHRRASSRRHRFEESLAMGASETDGARGAADTLADRDDVRRALAGVPPDQRQAVLLHHVEGYSFAEIAARAGVRVNAAKTRAFRGLKRMRALLARSDRS